MVPDIALRSVRIPCSPAREPTGRRGADPRRLALTRIEVSDSGATIGALVRSSELAYHPDIHGRYPLLAEALLAGASPQIRNLATVAGNLLQRTRCPYYRAQGAACNKRLPGSGCAAQDGDNRHHAILGGSEHCIATHASDLCVALVALDAVVHVRGPRGERAIAIADFHLLPEDHPERESVLEADELVTAVSLPPAEGLTQSSYVKVRDGGSTITLSSAAVVLRVEGGVVQTARIALGGVATKPWRARGAERMLEGGPLVPAVLPIAAQEALEDARTRPSNAFKVPLAKRTVLRALQTVCTAAVRP
jgi:xanthine dehydrogenase YagS FAD-binding subunit